MDNKAFYGCEENHINPFLQNLSSILLSKSWQTLHSNSPAPPLRMEDLIYFHQYLLYISFLPLIKSDNHHHHQKLWFSSSRICYMTLENDHRKENISKPMHHSQQTIKKDQMSIVWVWVTFRDVTNSNAILELMWWGFQSVQEAGKLHWHILHSLIGHIAERWIMTDTGDLEEVIIWVHPKWKVFLSLKSLKLEKRRKKKHPTTFKKRTLLW